MSFTLDFTTNIGKVRALVQDTSATDYILSDEEIQVYLDLESNDLYASAATALTSMAANQALLEKLEAAGDYKTDTRGIAKSLLLQAQAYISKSNSIPADAQAEVIYTDFNYREIEVNKELRGEDD